jgi:adenine deaminase
MLQKTVRCFGTRNMCMLANGRQADLVGAKIIRSVKALSTSDVNFFGYGGYRMAKQGFQNTLDINIDDMMDKEFHTFRRSKPHK